MKRFALLFLSFILFSAIQAQVPQAISYQAVVRDLDGALVTNKTISIRLSILADSIIGPKVYTETVSAIVNKFGIISLKIGTSTTTFGVFSMIDWSKPNYVKIEVDLAGGSNYVELSTAQLLTVPYSFYAAKAGSVDLLAGEGIKISDNTISVSRQMNITPRSAKNQQILTVTFSAGDSISFTQASNSSAELYGNVVFSIASSTQGSATLQGSGTVIYPSGTFLIDSKTLEATFDIPYNITPGLYDIILGWGGIKTYQIVKGFKIYYL